MKNKKGLETNYVVVLILALLMLFALFCLSGKHIFKTWGIIPALGLDKMPEEEHPDFSGGDEIPQTVSAEIISIEALPRKEGEELEVTAKIKNTGKSSKFEVTLIQTSWGCVEAVTTMAPTMGSKVTPELGSGDEMEETLESHHPYLMPNHEWDLTICLYQHMGSLLKSKPFTVELDIG